MRGSMRNITLLVLLGMLVCALPVAAQPVEITFWHRFTDDTVFGQAYNEIVTRFNELHPHIRVIAEPKAEGTNFEAYQLAVMGGAGPDVMWFERSQVSSWARAGLLEPFRGAMEIDPEDFLPGPFSEVVYNGNIWGVPWNTDLRGLFWNNALLEQGGFDSRLGPQTWDELNDWSFKLTRRSNDELTQVGIVPWVGNWFFPAWVWTFGGELYDVANGRATFDSPGAIEAAEWIASYLSYYRPEEVNALVGPAGDLFLSGKQAFAVNGDWSVSWYVANAGDIEFSVGRVPHPEGGRNGTWGGGFAIVVPKGTENLQEAMEFARWMGTAEPQLIYAKYVSALPTNWEAALEYVADSPEMMQRFYEQMTEANPRYPFIWLDVFNGGLEVYNRIVMGESPRNVLEQVNTIVQGQIDAFFSE